MRKTLARNCQAWVTDNNMPEIIQQNRENVDNAQKTLKKNKEIVGGREIPKKSPVVEHINVNKEVESSNHGR